MMSTTDHKIEANITQAFCRQVWCVQQLLMYSAELVLLILFHMSGGMRLHKVGS